MPATITIHRRLQINTAGSNISSQTVARDLYWCQTKQQLAKADQVTLVDEQQHVLVAGIPLDVLLQMAAACSQDIPCVQHLHDKHASALLIHLLHTLVQAACSSVSGCRCNTQLSVMHSCIPRRV